MKGFIKIDFPQEQLRTRNNEHIREVFDPIRKIWVSLTPEEWVRQHFISFLLSVNYPAPLIAVEKKIMMGDLVKRCDLVVYSRNMDPFMIIECKQMNVQLSQKVLDQALLYHSSLPTPYLVITNGSFTIGFKKENGRFAPVDKFPLYG